MYLILFIYILFIYCILYYLILFYFFIPFNEHMHSFWNYSYSSKFAQQLLQYAHMIGMVDNIMKILHVNDNSSTSSYYGQILYL